ncbi:MAG: virulence protein E [Prevotella sp.]|nr:virulence protein E [Prevotella sp.]
MIMFGTNIQSADDPLKKMRELELYQCIVHPEPYVDAKIRQLRVAYQISPKQYNEQKRTLPYVVCGIFNPPYRNTENFGYTECFVVDIDHLSDKGLTIDTVKSRIHDDERIMMYFTSPSEDGVKVMFRLRERCYDTGLYSLFYKEFLRRFSEQYQLEQVVDKRTSDVTRACFLSFDSEAYFNNDCESVDIGLYVQQSDPLARFDLMAKQKREEKKFPTGDTIHLPSDPDKEIMDKIKQCLHPNSKTIRKKPDAFVPEQLNMIIDDLVTYIQDTGLIVTEIIDIQYGKKLRISMGIKLAEINVFFGKRGFSVVKSPRSGTNAELNELTAQLIQMFVYQL